MQNKGNLHYIDKTKLLEEGNAAVGKTVAVNMLLQKHSQMPSEMLDFKQEIKNPEMLLQKLLSLKARMDKEELWLVLENVPETLDFELVEALKEMIAGIIGNSRVIFVSRNKPQMEFLELLWKNEMTLISMENLLFSLEEVREYVKKNEIAWNADEIYEKTGGWPGCVAVLMQMLKTNEHQSVEEYLQGYEIKEYIQHQMLDSLNEEEKTFLSFVACCPWINEKMLKDLWRTENRREKLENIWRKGFLIYESEKKRWKLSALFRNYIEACPGVFGTEYEWYEKNGYIAETIACVKKYNSKEDYRTYMLKYYDRIYALGLLSEEVLNWKEKTPRECYLRGVYYYSVQQFELMEKEIERLKKIQEKDFKTKEILLNLLYMNPQITLERWLQIVDELKEKDKKFELYHLLGNSVTYLCGTRDLSGLFACTAKAEKQKAGFWKSTFGETEWKCYQLARIDFYLETERKDAVSEDDWNLLRDVTNEQETWQIRMAKLYLTCKLQRIQPDEMYIRKINMLEKSLRNENDPVCVEVAECISCLYAPWYGVREKMSKWLRYGMIDSTVAVTEENYMMLYCRAKGYLLLNQFERAEKILKKLLPYLQTYRRNRFLTEVFFQCAMINMGKDLKGQAIKNILESFLLCVNSRYVRFYAGYGKKGQETLEAYIEWLKTTSPEGRSYKKKYNYGNVLHMPLEDYLDVVLRAAKKTSGDVKKFQEEYIEERLTMTETLILQNIGRGMSNAEICEELGVKLPTVKGHIYNIYKKLGVKNRGQALIKGKERGILE